MLVSDVTDVLIADLTEAKRRESGRKPGLVGASPNDP